MSAGSNIRIQNLQGRNNQLPGGQAMGMTIVKSLLLTGVWATLMVSPVTGQKANQSDCSQIDARYVDGWCVNSETTDYDSFISRSVSAITVTDNLFQLQITKVGDSSYTVALSTLNNDINPSVDPENLLLSVSLNSRRRVNYYLRGDDSMIDNYQPEITEGLNLVDREYEREFK